MMMDNYRSSPEILAAANSLIEKNGSRMAKELIPHCPRRAQGGMSSGEKMPPGGPVDCRADPEAHEEGTDYRDITIFTGRIM